MKVQRYMLSDEERWMTRRALAKDAEMRRVVEWGAEDRTRETLQFLGDFNPEIAAALRAAINETGTAKNVL